MAQVKSLQEKPASRLLSGVSTSAILHARESFKDHNSPEYRQAVYKSVREALDGMPFQVVENDLKSTKASYEMMSKSLENREAPTVL